jgi:hypothetical protein
MNFRRWKDFYTGAEPGKIFRGGKDVLIGAIFFFKWGKSLFGTAYYKEIEN